MTSPATRWAGLLAPLPRRAFAREEPAQLPRQGGAEFPPPPLFRLAARSATWALAVGWLGIRLGLDELVWGIRTDRNRGRRLREMFERMGGTAIKAGQQLAVRVDALPFEVCQELELLMDKVPPFSAERALERFRAATGRDPDEVFAEFRPQPIGAASVACVWWARLRTGEAVAVKVRRPDAVGMFSADLRTFDLFSRATELVGLVRPGYFRHLRTELRTMFSEELDFSAEARYHALFRRWVRRARGTDRYDAPRIHRELCGEDVVVTSFVSAPGGAEVVRAAETGDAAALRRFADRGIEPVTVARKLMEMCFWSRFENTFFHSDPHPGNVMIDDGSRVTMLDFGACGTMSDRNRAANMVMLPRLRAGDYQEAAHAAIVSIAPLPKIDPSAFRQRTERVFFHFQAGLEDPKAPWHDRTTASLWLGFLDLARDFDIPVNLETLREFRASLLYDTLVARFDPRTDLGQFTFYERKRQGRTRRRLLARSVLPVAVRLAAPVARLADRLAVGGTAVRPIRLVPMQAIVKEGAYAMSRALGGVAGALVVATTWIVTRHAARRALGLELPVGSTLFVWLVTAVVVLWWVRPTLHHMQFMRERSRRT